MPAVMLTICFAGLIWGDASAQPEIVVTIQIWVAAMWVNSEAKKRAGS